MKIIPAIDIMDGTCVRLQQGDFNKKVSYGDPLDLAKSFEDAGLSRLHLVDLDGARKGKIVNLRILELLADKTSLTIDFGGGIKNYSDAVSVFNAGAAMISVGSMAVNHPDQLVLLAKEFGAEMVWVGADVKGEKIQINGWQEDVSTSLEDFISNMISRGFNNFFCTDISKDGMLAGPATNLYKKIKKMFPKVALTASGGVSNLNDLFELQECGCDGAIVGKAFYEGKISLKQLAEF